MTIRIIFLLIWGLVTTTAYRAEAQCSPDTQAPIAVCDASLVILIDPGQTDTLFAHQLNEMSTDNCSAPEDLQLRIEGVPFSSAPPTTTFLVFDESDVGEHTVSLWVTDQAGNSTPCWGMVTVLLGGCNPLALPVCTDQITLNIPAGETVELAPDDVLEGTGYCENFSMQLNPPSSPLLHLTLNSSHTGTHTVQVTNTTTGISCWASLFVNPGNCTDLIPPVCIAPADTTITGEDWLALLIDPFDYPALNAHFGAALGWDDCGLDTITETSSLTFDQCNALLSISRHFVAVDNAGNTSAPAVQTIHIRYTYLIHIPQDHLPGDAVLEELTLSQTEGLLIGLTHYDEEVDWNCDSLPDEVRRTWLVSDECRTDISPQDPTVLELPRLDRNADGFVGDGYVISAQADSLYVLDNGEPGQPIGPYTGFFSYTQTIRYNDNDTTALAVAGEVFHDLLGNCSADPDDPRLAGWRVIATGQSTGRLYTAVSSATGLYEILGICPEDTQVELRLDVPFNYGLSCPTTWMVNIPPGMPGVQHIPVQLEQDCPLMQVDLAAPFLRRCFPNGYTVGYCNYSSQAIADVQVEVSLDPFMTFSSSELPATALGDNLFRFDIGHLQAGECGSFQLHFELDCEAVLGQTHCSTARILPDTLCPQLAEWSGANIEVEGNCEGDSVRLLIRNTGTGDMTEPLHFIVVEDVIMYMQDQFQLNSGQEFALAPIPAEGQTWHIQAEQVPAHPYPGSVAVTVEGCNGLLTTGLANIFPTQNPNPFIAVDCQENIGAFDPNDKAARPLGYGPERFIQPDTDLEYLIRFQNTGTDTAFTVVILDTLSQWLDPASVRPGAASHPFTFEVLDETVLRFTFSDILLPDSSSNEAASQGFVKFLVKQQPALDEGIRLENRAAIYFDFNEPIITNTEFHTISRDFIQVISNNTHNPTAGWDPLTVFPNPSAGEVTFRLPPGAPDAAAFLLHDQLGRVVSQGTFGEGTFSLQRAGLAPGMYFYRIGINGQLLYSGKLIYVNGRP